MFDKPVDDLNARDTLACARETVRLVNATEAQQLQIACHWAAKVLNATSQEPVGAIGCAAADWPGGTAASSAVPNRA